MLLARIVETATRTTMLVALVSLCAPEAPGETTKTPALTAKDLATADGSARVGMQADNSIVCILTATEARVKLDPDSWSSDDEATNYTSWLTRFDDSLYSKWLKSASIDGQETVAFTIADGKISISNGTFLRSEPQKPGQPVLEDPKGKFEAAIKSALDETLNAAPPLPQTKNKLKEIRTTLTFMRDAKVVPRYGKSAYGFVAVGNENKDVQVYGTTKRDGRSPGIQIVQDRGGGSIEVIDPEAFNEKCKSIEASQKVSD